MNSMERQVFLHSAFLFAEYKSSFPTSRFLSMLKLLKGSTDYFLWGTAITNLAKIEKVVCNVPSKISSLSADFRETYHAATRPIYTPTMQMIGWVKKAGEDENVGELLLELLGVQEIKRRSPTQIENLQNCFQ